MTDLGHPLVLRQPRALLEVLDEHIYLAESPKSVEIGSDGTASVPTRSLSAQTHWNAAAATRFALDCADHLLSEVGDVSLPDGTSLAKVTGDARQMLDGTASDSMEHLGRLARLRALRRLRHERAEITAVSLEELDDARGRISTLLTTPRTRPSSPSLIQCSPLSKHFATTCYPRSTSTSRTPGRIANSTRTKTARHRYLRPLWFHAARSSNAPRAASLAVRSGVDRRSRSSPTCSRGDEGSQAGQTGKPTN